MHHIMYQGTQNIFIVYLVYTPIIRIIYYKNLPVKIFKCIRKIISNTLLVTFF